MINPIKAVCLIMVLALSIQACDINIDASNTSSVPAIALTITAQAAFLQQGNPLPVSPSNTNPSTQENSSSPGSTPTYTPGLVSATATANLTQSGPVTVKVTVETNCRKGPGLIYASVYSMSVSEVADVIGKNTSTNYWIIKIPNGGGATCWLWGQYAILTGNTATLVEFAAPTPPATYTNTSVPTSPGRPAAPANVQVAISCLDQGNNKNMVSGTISWADNSNDELGFTISYPGVAVLVAANATSYNFKFIYSKNHPMQIGILANGKLANSQPVWVTTTCP